MENIGPQRAAPKSLAAIKAEHKQAQEAINEAIGNNPADTDADMEPDSGDAALSKNQTAYFDKPVRIHFHHVRNRLADIDGLSVKYVIDSLVAGNVLAGDTPKQVTEVTHSQSKGSPEETKIVIEEI